MPYGYEFSDDPLGGYQPSPEPEPDGGGYGYEFSDDPLQAGGFGPSTYAPSAGPAPGDGGYGYGAGALDAAVDLFAGMF